MPRRTITATDGTIVYNCPDTDTGHHGAKKIVRINNSPRNKFFEIVIDCDVCQGSHVISFETAGA